MPTADMRPTADPLRIMVDDGPVHGGWTTGEIDFGRPAGSPIPGDRGEQEYRQSIRDALVRRR